MLGGSVEVTLAEDDHSDVGVEVDFARFRAREPVAWIFRITKRHFDQWTGKE